MLRSTPLRLLTPNEKVTTILYAFDKLKDMPLLVEAEAGPKFIFAHIEAPHPSYVFDKEGKVVSNEPYDPSGKQWLDKQGYLGQLQFVNKKTLDVVEAILQNSKQPPVIIIQGDHGTDTVLNWVDHPNKKRLDERSYILNAYFFPGDGQKKLYPTISPVNTFRMVFNIFLGQKLPLLEDNTYFSNYYKTPYKFRLAYQNGTYAGIFPEEVMASESGVADDEADDGVDEEAEEGAEKVNITKLAKPFYNFPKAG